MTETLVSEIVLLTDSDPLQRSIVAQYLRNCGYKVIEATSAAEALAALSSHRIDILVSDIELRDASGFQLSASARESQPGLKVILTRSAERTAQAAADLCEDGPLDHPYHPQQLLQRMRRMRST